MSDSVKNIDVLIGGGGQAGLAASALQVPFPETGFLTP